jgi:hypothetical protein
MNTAANPGERALRWSKGKLLGQKPLQPGDRLILFWLSRCWVGWVLWSSFSPRP